MATWKKVLVSGSSTQHLHITSSGQISASLGFVGALTGTASNATTIEAGDLASTKVFVGNGSNLATAVSLGGEVTMNNAGAVTIENDAITTIKILNDNVTTAKINDLAVTTGKINDLAVTTGKIADDQVTGDKLANNITIAGNFAVAGTTLLGDNTADTVTINGNVTSSGTWALGNDTADYVTVKGNITSSGNISASGDIYFDNAYGARAIYHDSDPNTGIVFQSDSLLFKGNTERMALFGTTHGNSLGNPSYKTTITGSTISLVGGNVTASGQISASLGFVGDLTGTASYAATIKGGDLASATIFVGNDSDKAAAVEVSGDVSMNTAGQFTVGKINGVSISQGEATQLATIDSVTISNDQWGYVGGANQDVKTTSNVTFANIIGTGTTALGNDVADTVTILGNITGSAAGTISQSRIITDEVTGIATTGLTLTTNVTASGKISASLGFVGDLTGTASFVNSLVGTPLSDGKILIGDVNNKIAEFALTGDVTMTRGGVTSLLDDKVITTKILDANVTTAKINDGAVTSAKLANDITIANDLTVTGDLIVNGDTTQLSVTNLNVDDQFILLNSGSNSGDGGIIVQTAGAGGTHIGAGLGFDDSLARWVISAKDQIAHNATAFAPNAQGAPQMLVAVSASAAAPEGNPKDFGASPATRVGMMHVDTATEEIYIFS